VRDRIGYTEFSFGYAFTENLIRWSGQSPSSAPCFPNLVEEGQLGYDMHIALPARPLFFQFKLPELMVSRRAAEVSKTAGLPWALSPNFFRMSLMRRDRSDQHRLLIELEQSYPDAVFYASTQMETVSAFNGAYSTAAVHLQSALFSPMDIGLLPDDESHVVSYNTNAPVGFFCSEPKQVKLTTFEAFLPRLKSEFTEPGFSRLDQVAAKTLSTLREVGGQRVQIDESAVRNRFRTRRSEASLGRDLTPIESEVAEELFVSREIARIGLGVELIVAQPRS
jgi:hypothetical protein